MIKNILVHMPVAITIMLSSKLIVNPIRKGRVQCNDKEYFKNLFIRTSYLVFILFYLMSLKFKIYFPNLGFLKLRNLYQ